MKNGDIMNDSIKFWAFLFAVLSLASLSSCVRVPDDVGYVQQEGNLVFSAYWANEDSSRTTLSENGVDILWTPGESILLFCGEESARFTSMNQDTVAYTRFYGSIPVFTGTLEQEALSRPFLAVYPYDERNTSDGETVSLQIASEQKSSAGTFTDKFFPAVARSTTLDLAFYNVCGGVRFSVVHEGVSRVVFRSLDGSPMAGWVNVGFDEESKPFVSKISDPVDSVIVLAPEGGFVPGENYFATFIPQEHAAGISVSLYAKLKKAYGEIDRPICVKRSVFGLLDAVDDGWEYDGPDAIDFADEEVKRICLEYFDLDHDGEFSVPEAAAVKSIGVIFKGNTDITSFRELSYFTGLTEIEGSAFANCSNLEAVAFPESLVSIGAGAFAGCSSLNEIDFSACSLLKTIGASAFSNAKCLDVTLPAAVSTIGSKAFAPFKYVRLLAVNPPTISSDTFHSEARFGVPAEALKRYKNKKSSGTVWGSCANWIYSNDIFTYPPSLVEVSPTRKRLNLFGYTLDFIRVSPGSYSEGSNTVTISQAFWLAETEFTRALWIAVEKSEPTFFKATMEEAINCPVTYVKWVDLSAFISHLNALVPANYHLPTEAQWRFAAKGGTSSRNYTYSGSNTVGNVAWYEENSYCCLDTTGAYREQPHPVKTKEANELGFYDMSGNVAEWVSDYYGSSLPKGTDPTGPKSDSENRRVILGGDYLTTDSGCKVTSRYYAKQDVLRANVGFRLAL